MVLGTAEAEEKLHLFIVQTHKPAILYTTIVQQLLVTSFDADSNT